MVCLEDIGVKRTFKIKKVDGEYEKTQGKASFEVLLATSSLYFYLLTEHTLLHWTERMLLTSQDWLANTCTELHWPWKSTWKQLTVFHFRTASDIWCCKTLRSFMQMMCVLRAASMWISQGDLSWFLEWDTLTVKVDQCPVKGNYIESMAKSWIHGREFYCFEDATMQSSNLESWRWWQMRLDSLAFGWGPFALC